MSTSIRSPFDGSHLDSVAACCPTLETACCTPLDYKLDVCSKELPYHAERISRTNPPDFILSELLELLFAPFTQNVASRLRLFDIVKEDNELARGLVAIWVAL
ncbi:hypothetical protein PTI98_004099 [Pleurotus ostreatus]|nr:hypothetical protein PTI98_004099 [Pleurotus ostreatus]